MVRPPGFALLAALALGTAACALHTAPSPPVGAGPFRLRLKCQAEDHDPGAEFWALFDGALETVDGSRFPEGRWYFEGPRNGEDIVVSRERTLYGTELHGPPGGYSPRVVFSIGGMREGETFIRRLAVDVPMLEIVEGMSETFLLEVGDETTRWIGRWGYGFDAHESGVTVSTGAEDKATPDAPTFYQGTQRPLEHAWPMTDARGRRLRPGAGWTYGIGSSQEYVIDPVKDVPLAFPVRVDFRVPRRWRVTMQRFVFEDVRFGVEALSKLP